MKMNEAIESFLLYIKTERRLSDKTALAYSNDLSQFAAFLSASFGTDEVSEVTHLEVRDWEMTLTGKGENANSIRRRMATLRSFFKFLRRQRVVDHDIMAKVTAPKAPKRLPVFFTESEVAKIYDDTLFGDDFESRRDRLVLRMLYETGMRRAELLSLTEQSVDMSSGTVKVLGKRDKERIIPIEKELLHTIKEYFALKRETVGDREAFFVRSDGSAFTQYDVQKVVKKYMTLFSNADRISPHVFRHSFATHLLNEGADINAIKELLGHTDLAATEIYTHITRQHLQEAYRHSHPRETRKNEQQ